MAWILRVPLSLDESASALCDASLTPGYRDCTIFVVDVRAVSVNGDEVAKALAGGLQRVAGHAALSLGQHQLGVLDGGHQLGGVHGGMGNVAAIIETASKPISFELS
jgi:hypothetical protein